MFAVAYRCTRRFFFEEKPMIENWKETHTYFSVACKVCGDRGPKSRDREECKELALEHGWTTYETFGHWYCVEHDPEAVQPPG